MTTGIHEVHAVHIATLRSDVDELFESNKAKDSRIMDILITLEGVKTRLAIWGAIITVGTPLVSGAVAWVVLKQAGAQLVVPTQSAAHPAALSSRALAGIGEKP